MPSQWYICQCKRKKLTKKQVTEKEAALKRKQKRHGTHKDNSGKEGCDLHLLSKALEKKTDCNSKMAIRINRNKNMPYQCEIDIWCQQGVSGNACPHQAAVALKLRINNINFIPQTAKERFNLAILAIGDKKNFSVGQFVSLHQKEIESKPPFYGDQEKDEEQQTLLPMPDSPETETMDTNDGIIDAGTDATVPNDEVSLDQIIKLHQQVSQDIEYKLRTSDNYYNNYYK